VDKIKWDMLSDSFILKKGMNIIDSCLTIEHLKTTGSWIKRVVNDNNRERLYGMLHLQHSLLKRKWVRGK
jgi:hypothetical protein